MSHSPATPLSISRFRTVLGERRAGMFPTKVAPRRGLRRNAVETGFKVIAYNLMRANRLAFQGRSAPTVRQKAGNEGAEKALSPA